MCRELSEIAEKRMSAALLLADSGEYADALIVLLEAVKDKMNAAHLAASLREGVATEASTDCKRLFAENNFFEKDWAAVLERLEDSVARSSSARHRIDRKEFFQILDAVKLFFQEADSAAAGRKPAGRTQHETEDAAGLLMELLRLADGKLSSATLLFDAGKYDECLIVLCEAFKIKLKSLVLFRRGQLPDEDVFALCAEYFSPECDLSLKGNFLPLVRQMEGLCSTPSIERSIDRSTCRKLLDGAALFFREANRAAKKNLPSKTRKAPVARMLRAALWLAGIAGLFIAGYLVSGFPQKSDGGLAGAYYRGTDLSSANLVFKRKDPAIDFNWTEQPPDPRMPLTQYSVRWTGKFYAATDRDYEFFAFSDDGVRLWVKNTLIIDSWQIHAPSQLAGRIFLKTGWHDIRLDYFQAMGDASIRLLYDGGFLGPVVIPPENFKP
jgi:hypothetical protein